jgi:hypothetical protein
MKQGKAITRPESTIHFLDALKPASEAERHRYWLVGIILLATFFRVAAALYLGDRVVDLPGTFDQISYDMLAQRVLNGQGFTVSELWWPATPAGAPTAHWSYLYTLYLVFVYGVSGYHPLIARLIQAALAGILMPWLAYRIGRRHFGPRVGLVSAGLVATYIYFVYYAGALMTETFYIIGILWTLDLASQLGQGRPDPTTAEETGTGDHPRDRQSKATGARWLSLGLALGTTVLLRQVFLLFIPFLFAWLLLRSLHLGFRAVIRRLGILAGATAILVLLIAPWTFRNFRAFDQFVLLNTNAGFAFFWGNHPIHGYNFIAILPADGPSYQELIPSELLVLNEAELDRVLLKKGLSFIQEDPGRYLILSLTRIKDYFKFWPSPESGLISNVSRVLSFGLLMPFMLYGLIHSLRHYSAERLILYLFAVTYTGIHLLTWALIRYRLPVDAVLLVFAGAALVSLHTKLTHANPD